MPWSVVGVVLSRKGGSYVALASFYIVMANRVCKLLCL